MPQYSFDEDFVKTFTDYDSFTKWSNGRHDESALKEVYDATHPAKVAEPVKKVKPTLNVAEGGE